MKTELFAESTPQVFGKHYLHMSFMPIRDRPVRLLSDGHERHVPIAHESHVQIMFTSSFDSKRRFVLPTWFVRISKVSDGRHCSTHPELLQLHSN